MASRTALLVTLVSLVSWIAAGTKTVKEILEMEEKLNNDVSEWDPRVIGGRDALEREFPWMVALHYKGRFVCSAFLVTPNYVMTAAHCVELRGDDPEPPEDFASYVGTIHRDGPDTKLSFSNITSHEKYGSGTEYDIALLKLETPVETDDNIQPICLPSEGSKFEDLFAQVMGWGVYKKNGREPSKVLMTNPEHVPKLSRCQAVYGMMGILVTERHVCAGGKDTGVCYGDSGGPLVMINGTEPKATLSGTVPVAIGLTSFGSFLGCAVNRVPAVFTSIPHYNAWIIENMGEDAKNLCYA